MRVQLLLLRLALATHIIYTQYSVILNQTTSATAAPEMISLQDPVPLVGNSKYAVTFQFSSNVSRTYMGANDQNSRECALFVTQDNSLFVQPASIRVDFEDGDLYLNPSVGSTTISNLSEATVAVNYSTSVDAGFGQTFHSSSGKRNLTSITLLLGPGMGAMNAVNTTLRIYYLPAFANVENVSFLLNQETLSPIGPSPEPTTQQPTTAFFQPPGCDFTSIPSQYRDASIVCSNSNSSTASSTDVVVSNVVTIAMYDENGTELLVNNLPPDRQITFFVPLTSDGAMRLGPNPSNPCEPQPDVSCAWLGSDRWHESGCQVAPELGQTNANGSFGRFCVCNHLTSFSLVLRYRTDPTAFCRSTSQYVWAGIFAAVALLATLQMGRAFYALRTFAVMVLVHLGIVIAALVNMTISLLIPLLATKPALLVFLSSVVTIIELTSYIYLVYVWTRVSGKRFDSQKQLKYPFVVFLVFAAGTAIGFPVAMLASSDDAQLSLARAGSYMMSCITFIICCALSYSGFRLRAQLADLQKNTHTTEKKLSIRSRITTGSIGLSVSVMAQALLWSLSVDESVLNDEAKSDAIELGFNFAAFLTFLTLLFMFFFGVHEAFANSRKEVSTPRSKGRALGELSLRSTGVSTSEVTAVEKASTTEV